jgi:hypothetical protein
MSQHRAAVSIRLPYPPYLWKVVRRSAVMWLLVRCAYAGVLMAALAFGLLPPAAGIAEALHPAWPTRILIVALTAFFVWWDRKRSHELLLPANLGAWPGWFWTASLLTALVVDIVVQALLSAL